MSATVVCHHPNWCKVKRHVAGTAAALACAKTAMSRAPAKTAPPAPAHRANPEQALIAQVQAALPAWEPYQFSAQGREASATKAWAGGDGDWTSGCGRPHPTGGYHRRRVTAMGRGDLQSVQVHHFDADGKEHREDGPAFVELGHRGQITLARWLRHQVSHREDGPARVEPGAKPACDFYLEGRWLGTREDGFSSGRAFADMVEAGAQPAEAVGWLEVIGALGEETTNSLREDGVQVETACRCVGAGVLDPETIAAVARGELPISWASAGR